ncbi:MAG: YlbF family regulator [Verrucomicrobia bacterium]|nr:YlbF family regulator [Verrucomicrobiota bacterium]
MSTAIATDSLTEKTLELCQAILEQPNFAETRARIDAFMGDELLKYQFQMVSQRGDLLQMKQQGGVPLTDAEIGEFEKMRDELMANPLAKNFVEAQNEFGRIQSQVGKYMSKTFELGRVPTAEDMDDGSCCNSGGCGCS